MKDKEAVVHIYDGILLGYKKEWNNGICSNMDGPRHCHIEWSKSENEKHHMTSLLCRTFKKWYIWTYLQNRNRCKDLENERMVTRG